MQRWRHSMQTRKSAQHFNLSETAVQQRLAAETHFFTSVFGHLSPVSHVTFVTQDHLLHIRRGMLGEVKRLIMQSMLLSVHTDNIKQRVPPNIN